MDAKKLIDALGGCQAAADELNKLGDIKHSRQRVWNWYRDGKIPPWAQIEYAQFWKHVMRKKSYCNGNRYSYILGKARKEK